MKPLKIPLFVVGMLAPFLLTAQSLHLTGSNPANQSLNVPLTTTVSFTFDDPLEPGITSLDSIGNWYLAVPNDKIVIHSLALSADSHVLNAVVTHQPDAEVTWVFYGVRAVTGEVMRNFQSVTYSTGAAWSPASIQGRLVTPDSPNATYSSTIVMLLSDLTFMDSSNNDGPDQELRYAVAPDPTTGAYAFPSVKPGSYYVMAMSFPDLQGNMDPFAYATLTDTTEEPVALVVADVPINGLDLVMQPMQNGEPQPAEPTDASAVFTLIRDHMAIHAPAAEPLVMESGMPSQTAIGEYHDWMVVYFNAADSMLFFVYADANRVQRVDAMPYRDMPPTERPPVSLSSIKRIAQPFVPSRAAFQTVMMNGLAEILSSPNDRADVRMRLSHLYFEYPQWLTVDSNPFWLVQVRAQNWNGVIETDYLVDGLTGAYLGSTQVGPPQPNPLQLMQTTPMPMSVDVPLQSTVRFTFNEPIRPETFNMESLGRTWMVLPQNAIAVNGVAFTDYNRTVEFNVSHSPNVDVTWVMYDVRSQEGATLDSPGILTYTTSSAISPIRVEGSMIWPTEISVPDPNQVMNIVVLLNSADYFLNGMQGPPPDIRSVGTTMPGSWAFVVDNVRPGTYFPAVFVMPKSMNSNGPIAVGFIPDEQGRPTPIQVVDRSVVDIQLRMLQGGSGEEHHPIDVSAVADGVRAAVNAQGTGAVLLTLWGREEIQRPTMPTGVSYDWGFVFYEPATDTVQVVQAHSGGMFSVERFHISSIPEEERMPAELVQPLPTGFISSGQAVNTALTNGLAQLIHVAPYDAWMQVRYELNRFYFLYPGVMNSDSPPFWRIQFNAERWGAGDQLLWSQEALYLVNAIDGALIHQTLSTGLDDADAPTSIRLDQNYPNPFNPSTVIRYSVGTQDLASLPVRLTVYDVLGREVAVLVDERLAAGSHSVTFDASNLPSGVYLYRLVAGGQTLQRKLTLLR